MNYIKGAKLTYVGVWHFTRLTYRSVLFVLLLIGYIRYRFNYGHPLMMEIEKVPAIIYVVWAVFVIEMIARFFPSKYAGTNNLGACAHGCRESSLQVHSRRCLQKRTQGVLRAHGASIGTQGTEGTQETHTVVSPSLTALASPAEEKEISSRRCPLLR